MSRSLNFYQSLRLMLQDLGEDIDRYVYMGNTSALTVLLTCPGLWVSCQYRVSRWVHCHLHVPLLRQLGKLICTLWQRLIVILTGVELPNRAVIGGGLFIAHANGIIVHNDAQLGRHCNLGQQVTIGVGGRAHRGTPVIGDRAFVGPGAKLFGPIHLGHDVAVGANAVVLKDVPDNAVVAGIPAQVMNYQGSQDFVLFRGCVAHRAAGQPVLH